MHELISALAFQVVEYNITSVLDYSVPLDRLIFLSSPGEAVGHLLCVFKQNSLLLPVQSQAETIVRTLWAQPSAGGAHVVATVLSNSAHLVEW